MNVLVQPNQILTSVFKRFIAKRNNVCNYMNKKKRRFLISAFITSQFSYCPLVRMPHRRTMNNRINKIHEKA